MKIAGRVFLWFLASIGGFNFVVWLAGFSGSPFESLAPFLRYPQRYGYLEMSRIDFLRDGCGPKVAELKRRLVEDPVSKGRLQALPNQPRMFHIPQSIIPVGVPYRESIRENFSSIELTIAILSCDSAGNPESITIGGSRAGYFVPIAKGVGPPDFVASLKISENPLVFAFSHSP